MSTNIAQQKRAIIAAIMAVVLLVGLMVPTVSAYAEPTSAEKRAEAQQVLEQLEEMQTKLDEASNNYYAALEAQEEAEAKVVEAQEKVDQKTEEIEGYQEQLGDRARDMYRSGSISFVDVILGASSFEEFATTWNVLEMLNEDDAELVQQTKDAREELEAAKTEAEEQAQIAADKTAEAEAVKEEAEATTAEMQETYDQLSAEAEELLRQEEEAAERARQASAQAALQNQSGGGNNNKTPTVTGNVIVDRAYAQLGKPYVWGASGPNSFDCSGLVGYCITGTYGNHWCTTYSMASWTPVSNPKPGDFCLNSHHTGVYIGNGQMIHAPRAGDVVKISAVYSDMYYVRY
mgnify:CR=1 FL=1